MHFYNFHVNDFRGATWHLNRLQRGIYRDLIDEYYLNESALKNNLNELAHKMACHSEEEKTALSLVLREFFTLRNGKWHHKRINREIKAFRFSNGNSNGVTNSNETVTESVTNSNEVSNAMSNAERQAKLREQAKQMKAYLNGLCVEFNQKMPFGELKKLFISNGGSLETVTENKNSVTESVTECNAETEAITKNQEPRTKNQVTTTARGRERFQSARRRNHFADGCISDALELAAQKPRHREWLVAYGKNPCHRLRFGYRCFGGLRFLLAGLPRRKPYRRAVGFGVCTVGNEIPYEIF